MTNQAKMGVATGTGGVIRKGLLVEDETVVGGTDSETGAPVIKPKTEDGTADESVTPTDESEDSIDG